MFGFGRKKKDVAPKKATNRGRGAGRTRGTRADDLEQVRDKRRPQGVTSPIRDAAKAAKPPTNRVKPPKVDAVKTPNNIKDPASGLAKVTGTPQGKTGSPRRNVGSGREKKANVTREQLQKTGLTLRDYLNFMDKNSRRPTKADAAAAKKLTAGFKAKKMMGGGMAMKSKGYAKGGMMKTKMGTKGGAMGGAKGYSEGREVKADKAAKAKAAKEKAAKARRRLMPGLTTRKAPRIKGISKNMSPTSTFSKGRSVSGKLPMVEKDGKMIPAYAADGKGKMMAGGKVKSKGMAKGGMMKTKGGAMKTKGYKKGGKVRGAGIARKGVRPAKMY